MSVSAAPLGRPRLRLGVAARAAVPLALLAIAAVSLVLRTIRLGESYWIDEGLSVGIADRPITDIPSTMRLDGSPPLYYMLLHLWMRVVGSQGEHATHALSLIFAIAAIPVAWAFARALFGPRAGWIAAVLFALNPFLTAYAQETRMYSLVVLLGTVVTATFVGAFVCDRGRVWLAGFVASSVVLLYTHNWGLFLGSALALGWVLLVVVAREDARRRLVRDGLIAVAGIVVAYAPWLPSFVFQAQHTGAPWALAPGLLELRTASAWLLWPTAQYVLLLAGGAGLVRILGPRAPRAWTREGRAAAVLILAAVGTPLVAWLASQVAPAWAIRYLAVEVPPLLLLASLGLARAGGLGLAGLALVASLWIGHPGPAHKSNAREIAQNVAPALQAGDLVISTQPEQIPVLHHYLRVGGLTWATITGRVRDLGVTDWRDGPERLRAASLQRDLEPLLDRLRPGQHVALVRPRIVSSLRWRAPWTAQVRLRSDEWELALRGDPRFQVVAEQPAPPGRYRSALRSIVLVRTAMR